MWLRKFILYQCRGKKCITFIFSFGDLELSRFRFGIVLGWPYLHNRAFLLILWGPTHIHSRAATTWWALARNSKSKVCIQARDIAQWHKALLGKRKVLGSVPDAKKECTSPHPDSAQWGRPVCEANPIVSKVLWERGQVIFNSTTRGQTHGRTCLV